MVMCELPSWEGHQNISFRLQSMQAHCDAENIQARASLH